MALYHERHPSTGITHCSRSYFTHVPRQARDSTKSLPDVIVVRSNLLQIYKVRVPYDKSDAASLAESKLEQTASFPLAGLVDSMAVLRGRSSSQKDALLLTFRDAKLSVLDWDDNAHTIHTSSLHYFEGDPSLRMGRTVFPMGPKVVTDPQGRCAAVLIFHTQLALLPAMETEGLELDLMMDDPYGEGVEGPGRASTELVSATVGNSYVVNLAKMGIKKVRDVVFLHKYNEPVLLILHEVEPTWPARYRDAKDTMALAALSVNVVHKRHPRIWEASGLPSDTFRLVPVLTGGALALSQNMITYHTQGASSGLVVNSHALPGKVPEKLEIDVEGDVLPAQLAAEHAAKYPDNVHPESAPAMAATSDHSAAQLMLDLSAARHVWLSKSSVALLLKSGRLLLAHLTIEAGMVKQMRVEPSLNLGVASCGCQLGSNLVFLGSCLANSLLVHVTHLQESKKRGRDGDGFRDTAVSSKRARLEATDAPGPGTHVSTGDKEEEESKQSKQALVTDRLLSFKVVDKLMGIGPMRDMAIGDPVSSAPGSHDRRGPHQLVACSGQGKHGALTVLRRSLVPELIVQVPQEVKGVWAVHHADAQTDTGDAMNQLTDAGAFVTDAPTICAGNILKHTLIVQVYPTGVKVVAGLEEVQDLPIQDILPSMEWRPQVVIAAACIADPYLLLHFSDGSAVLLSGDEEEGCLIGQDAANQALQADINADPTLRLTAATLYRDNSGWLHQVQSAHSAHLSPAQSEPEALAEGPAQMTPGAEGYDGVVEVEDAGLEGGQEGGGSSPTPLAAEQAQTHVTEARLESFGPTVVPGVPACNRPVLLLLLSDGTLLTYQAFHPPHQPLAFRRVPLDWTPHMTLTQEPPGPVPHPNAVQPTDRMQRFDNLGEGSAWSGIFILGAKPLWLLASRGKLVAHPMEVEGAVAGFSPFHNPSCPQGFVTTGMHDKACSLNICQMPAEVQLGTPWPLQRVAMQATPHRVTFYPEAGLYVVLLSKDGPHKEWLEAEEGGDMHAAYSYALAKESAKIKPKEAGYEVRLIRPGTWKGIWSHALGPAEDALCVKAMQLKNAKTGESEPVVAVGTCQSFGEDYPGTGRVLFFQITRKPAEGSEAEEQWATNMIYSREFRGPVTNLTSLEGYIILTIGNRLETHQWTGSNLLRTAFFDAPILISSLNVVKTYIIFGDVHKGIYFVNYRDQGKQLNLLSKDFDNSDISATEFVINGSQLHFLAADEGLNVRLFRYSNKTALSWKGQKLLPLGCLHTGHRVTRFLQQRVNSTDAINRHAAVFATQAGSLGYITPLLNESMEPLLQKLQRQMVVAQPQPAGLNPAAFRRRFQRSSKSLAGGQHFGKPLPAEGIIDGTSVFDYQHLTRSQQAVFVHQTQLKGKLYEPSPKLRQLKDCHVAACRVTLSCVPTGVRCNDCSTNTPGKQCTLFMARQPKEQSDPAQLQGNDRCITLVSAVFEAGAYFLSWLRPRPH
ncbi:hypothetical protein WJX82_007762 [Trebouxia sp. C0006]